MNLRVRKKKNKSGSISIVIVDRANSWQFSTLILNNIYLFHSIIISNKNNYRNIMNKKLHLVSLGCTKNLVDSEVMLGKLSSYQLTDEPKEADIIIVNTCGFIESAKSESLQTVLDLHEKRKEDSLLVMAGCLSERYKEELQQELKEVDIFTGVGDYDKIDELVAKKQNP